MLTAKERILASIAGEKPDRVPVTAYTSLVPRGWHERALRNAGLALVNLCTAYQATLEGVRQEHRQFERDGEVYHRHSYITPVGEIASLGRTEPACGSLYKVEHYIKDPRDYQTLAYIWEHTSFRPDYERLERAMLEMGQDGIVGTSIDRTPFQKLLVEFAGVERMSIDLHERPQEIEQLLDIWAQRQTELCHIAAGSPAELVWVPDNITGEVIGADRFARHCLPIYRKLNEILSAAGKHMFVHMDGKLNSLKHVVAESEVPIVEAFTPPPDGDLSVAEARRLWPDKVLWLNFPSSVHLAPPDKIAAATRALLEEAGDCKGFLIGVTENIPPDAWAVSLRTILDEVNRTS